MHDMHLGRFSVKFKKKILTNEKRPKYSEIHYLSNWNQI